MAALLASEITLPNADDTPELRARAEKMLPELEPDAARRVRACLALVYGANIPTEEMEDHIVRDLDVPMVMKAMALFPASTMSQAARMADNLAEQFSAVADCIRQLVLGTEPTGRVEKDDDGSLRIYVGERPEPTPAVADAPRPESKPIVPHNGGRGPKPPVS
jgi:hypothetical protein